MVEIFFAPHLLTKVQYFGYYLSLASAPIIADAVSGDGMVGGPHPCWAVLNYLLDEVAHFKAIISCKATNHKSVLMPLPD